MFDPSLIAIAVTVYFIAGIIKGTLGIGFPTAAVALMAFLVDARLAIALVVIPMATINAWQIMRSGNVVLVWQKNKVLLLCMAASIGVFSLLAVDVPIRWLTLFLGIVTTLFSFLSLWRRPPELPKRLDRVAQIFTGLFSGVLGGIAGIWAPPIIVYLSAKRVETEEFVQTVGVLLFIGSVFLLVGYVHVGIINSSNMYNSAVLIVPAILGFAVGERVRGRLGTAKFQRWVLIFFAVSGLNLIRRAIMFQ